MAEAKYTIKVELDDKTLRNSVLNTQEFIQKKLGSGNMIEIDLGTADIKEAEKAIDRMCGKSKELAAAMKKAFAEQRIAPLQKESKMFGEIKELFGNTNKTQGNVTKAIITQLNNEIKKAGKTGDSAELISAIKDMLIKINSAKGLGFGKDNGFSKVDGRKLFAPYNFNDIYNDVVKGITTNLRETFSSANGTLDSAVGDLLNWMDNVGKRTSIDHKGFDSVDKIINNLNDQLSSVSNFSDVAVDVIEQSTKEVEKVAKAAEDAQKALKKTKPSSKKKNTFEGLDEDSLENAFYDITDKDAENKKFTKKDQQDLTQILGAARKFGEEYVDNLLMGVDQLKEDVNREMIESIMDSLETLSSTDKSAKILPDEIKDLSNNKMLNDFIASVRDVRKNLKEYKDYLEVIYDLSEITKDLGEGNLAEVGYNGSGLISYGTGGKLAGTYANKTMEVDYHSHPITKFDQLLPSFTDIIAYIDELKNVDKKGNPYLKEAYISSGDRILKMDFSQIDFANLDLDAFGKELADSMANAMKKAGAKAEWDEEKGTYEYSTRSVLVDKYATAVARRALGDTLAKYGGSLSTAIRNSDGQFIDSVTGKAWKARGDEDVSDSLTSAAMSLTEQIEMLERTIREVGGNISVGDKEAKLVPQKGGRIPKAEIANYDRAQSLIKFLNDQVEIIRKTHVEGGKSEASVNNNTYVSELKSMITMLKHYVNGAREFKYDNELLEWAKTQFIPTKFNEKTVKNADGIDIKISEPVEATLDELKAIIDKKWNEVFDALTDGGDVLGQFEKKVSTSSSQVANLGRKIEPEIVEVEDALVDAIATIENKAKEVGRSVDNYQGLAKMKKDLENIQKYKRGDKLDKEGTNYINSVLNKTGMSQNEYIRKEGVRFEDALLTKNQFASLVRGIKTYFVGEVTGSKSTKKSEMSEEQIAEVNAKTKELTNLFNELNIQTQGEAKAWREALKFGNSAREIINIYRQTMASNLEGRRSDSWKPTYQKYKEDMSKNPTGSLATAEDLERTRQIAETRADAIDSAVEGIVKAEERIANREADVIGPSGMRTSLQSNKPLISTEKRVIYEYNDGNESGRPDKIITEYQKSVEDSCDNILANIARYKSEAINNLLLGDFNYERNKKTGEVNIVRQLTSREKDKLRKEEEEAQKDITPVDTKDPNQVLADFRVEEKEYNEKRIEEAKKLLELKEQEYAAEKERVDRINAEEQSLSKEEYIRARMSDKIAEMEEEAIKQLNNEGNGSAVERQRIYDLSMQDIDYFKNRMNGDISENIEAVKDKSAKELHQTLNELFDERKKTQEEIQKLNDVMTAATQGESGKKSKGKNLNDSTMKALERTLMENAEVIRQTSFERDFKDAVIFEEGRVDDKGNYVETTGRLVQLEEEMAELRKITNQTNEKVKKVVQKPKIVKAPIEPEPEPEIVRPVASVPTVPVNTDVDPTGNVVINTDQAEINTKTTDSENIDNAKAINIGSGGKLSVNGTNATTAPAQKAKSKNEVKTVDDERIRSLYQQFIRYQNDSSVQGNKDIYNTLQGLLEDINDFRYSTKSEKQFKNIVNRTDNFKFEIEALKQLNKMYDDTYDRRRKIAELEATGENPELLKQLKDAQDAAENQMRNWAKGLKFGAADIDDTWIANVIGKKDEVEDYAKDLIRRITSVRTSIDNAMKQKTQTGYGYTEEFKINVEQVRDNANAVILQLSNIGEAGENTAEILKNAEQIIETLGQQRISVNSSETVTKKVTQVQDLLNKASNLINNTGMLGVDSGDREKMYNVYGQLKAITDAAKDAEGEMTTISRIDYDRLDEQLKELELKYKQLGNYGVNAFQRISRSLKAQMAAQFARYFSLYDLIRYVRTGVNTIKELDTAMVELRKVTDGTAQEYADFRKEIRATATEIAATNKDLISSSADWSRLGYSIKEATELAKDAQIFVNVGDGVDIKGATDMMITAMKAFNIEAGEALSIVDKYNEIGKILPSHMVTYDVISNYIGQSLETDETEVR